jgi:hypothetical protein
MGLISTVLYPLLSALCLVQNRQTKQGNQDYSVPQVKMLLKEIGQGLKREILL